MNSCCFFPDFSRVYCFLTFFVIFLCCDVSCAHQELARFTWLGCMYVQKYNMFITKGLHKLSEHCDLLQQWHMHSALIQVADKWTKGTSFERVLLSYNRLISFLFLPYLCWRKCDYQKNDANTTYALLILCLCHFLGVIFSISLTTHLIFLY